MKRVYQPSRMLSVAPVMPGSPEAPSTPPQGPPRSNLRVYVAPQQLDLMLHRASGLLPFGRLGTNSLQRAPNLEQDFEARKTSKLDTPARNSPPQKKKQSRCERCGSCGGSGRGRRI